MSNTIEIEAKALVKKAEYAKLAALFKTNRPYIQTNYYIDNNASLLRKEGIALRVRKKKGECSLTLKAPLSEGLLEKNSRISKETFEKFAKEGVFPEGDTKRFLTMLNIDVPSLKILTSLTTKRIDADYEGGLLSIDENHYEGKTDYEVELEYNNEGDAERILAELFKKNGIPFAVNKRTKVSRALEASIEKKAKKLAAEEKAKAKKTKKSAPKKTKK
jgi:uncharacterized protein YjbK